MDRRLMLGWMAVLVALSVVVPAFATTIYLPVIGGAPATRTTVPTGAPSTSVPAVGATPTLVPATAVPPVTAVPTVVPPDGSYPLDLLVITHTSTFVTREGNPAIMGEVLNQGADPAYKVWMIARGYDATQTLVATTGSTTLLNAVHGGDRVPFLIVFRGITTAFDHITVTFRDATNATSRGYNDLPVTIASQTVVTTTVDNQPRVEVRGVVRNDGTSVLEARVAVTFYDAQGGIVDVCGDFSMPTTLTPQSTSTFVLQVDHPGSWTHYRLQAQGFT